MWHPVDTINTVFLFPNVFVNLWKTTVCCVEEDVDLGQTMGWAGRVSLP